jgi:hypothetical protein
MADDDLENTPDLSISPDKVCYIIVKAREFDAKDVVTDPDDGSNPTDDAMVAVLEDHRDDPVVQEIAAAIAGRGRARPQQADRLISARHATLGRLPKRGLGTARPFVRRVMIRRGHSFFAHAT